jgi:hypothetical protein
MKSIRVTATRLRVEAQYDPKYTDHPDFVGFHCQERERNKYDDFIGAQYGGVEGGQNYLIHILDALYNEDRFEAMELGLMDTPDNPYDEDYEAWAKKVEDFLASKNVKWIFVSETRPLSSSGETYGGYGDHCYYVLMPQDIILTEFHDIGVNDLAMAYVYDANKGQPELIEIELEEAP